MSLGGPSLGMAVDVFDDAGQPVRGQVGELVCTKPWPGMTRGLVQGPRALPRDVLVDVPGVWGHGDWASVDEDGDWFLHGRSDDTIKVAGKRLGPAEVESVLVSHPSVVEAAAVGMPDEVKGEALWCFVVLGRRRRGRPTRCGPSSSTLVADRLGKSFRPSAVRFTTALPEDPQRQGPAPGDPCRRSSATTPATCRRSRTRRRSTPCGRPADAAVDRSGAAAREAGHAPSAGAIGDFEAWREVRTGASDWLTKWEPQRVAGPSRPDARTAAPSPPGAAARERERQLGIGYGFGIFVDDRFCGEINLNSSSGVPSRTPTSATGSTRRWPGSSYMPEAVVVLAASPSRSSASTGCRSRSSPATGSRRVVEKLRHARRGRRRALPRDQRRRGRTTSATPSPPRSGPTGATSSGGTGSSRRRVAPVVPRGKFETDYLVVGAGAMGMAFTDALVDHADVHVTLVDRRHAAGGHWLQAYPFVQLHQASVFYGVASTVLGDGATQTSGPEAGLQERARQSEIQGVLRRPPAPPLPALGQGSVPRRERAPQGGLPAPGDVARVG